MNRFKKPLQLLLAVIAATQLTACSKTVQWEEEVRLNTGETIVVKRNGTYAYNWNLGLAFSGFSPDPTSTIKFAYKGIPYAFTGEPGLLLLAIAPDGLPNLIADPRNNEWHWKNKYYCVKPYYVQFKPKNSAGNWMWPEQIEPWLYDLPTNLMRGLAPLADDGKKYAAAQIEQVNRSVTGTFPEFVAIKTNHVNENTCPRRN